MKRMFLIPVVVIGEENVKQFAEGLRDEMIDLGLSMSHGQLGTFDVQVAQASDITLDEEE